MQFIARILLLSLAVLGSAFKALPVKSFSRPAVHMTAGASPAKQAARIATAVVSILSAGVLQLAPVQAANYGGFGSTYAAVLDPKKAEMNEETYKSGDVTSALEGVKGYTSTVAAMRADLAKDSQTPLSKRLFTELSPGKLRTVLNKYNNAFAEDTQRGTDRLIRNILQDVTELEREAIIKPGKARPESKVRLIERRLAAAETSLKELCAFYPTTTTTN
ncbi:hypothetical protein B484DRAFT_402649 [Ochromonadaceae sp. CCMP2298]|nr:hypothetical protein B484DRAFT_402649 [Ochromonadaceae sp. CCMP2298]